LRFAVIGGDSRSALLCSLLQRDGHRVHSYALEKAEMPREVAKVGCLQSALYGADCVILPLPSEKGALINSPLSAESVETGSLVAALWPGQLLCGAKLSQELSLAAIHQGLRVEDIMQRRGFTVMNAALTAEGAISLLLQNGRRSLWGSRALVTGWGRIAKILALRLFSLGAQVTIAARKEGDRAMARALGLDALDFGELERALPGFHFIVNTVPGRVLSDELLCLISEDAEILELASPPGGFDRNLAENIALKVTAAPGLPGKHAPLTAAELIRDTIYAIIREQEE